MADMQVVLDAPTDEAEVTAVIRKLLADNATFFLSTTGKDGPWGAGAFFAEDGLFELTLVLELHGRTLRNIRQDPRVAMVVSSGNPYEPFLQGAAHAEVLDGEEAMKRTTAHLMAKAPQIEPILGAPIAALRLHVELWRATDIVNGWLPAKELRAPARVG